MNLIGRIVKTELRDSEQGDTVLVTAKLESADLKRDGKLILRLPPKEAKPFTLGAHVRVKFDKAQTTLELPSQQQTATGASAATH